MDFVHFGICIIIFFFLPDFLSLVFGLILTCFSYEKHPRLHRVGVRMLAKSGFVPDKVVSKRCQMPCDCTKCGNWNCPNYSCPENGKKAAKYGSIKH